MKPRFTLRIQRLSKARCVITREKQNQREKQFDDAVNWCRTHNTRGYAAIASGNFSLIRDPRTINKRLDGYIVTGKEKDYCRYVEIV